MRLKTSLNYQADLVPHVIAILCFMAIVTVEELLVIVAWMKQSRGGIGGQFPLQKHFTPLKLALNTDH